MKNIESKAEAKYDVQSKDRNESGGETITGLLVRNVIHVAPTVLYASLGIGMVKPLPYIGKISPLIPVSFFLTNVIARYDEANGLIDDAHERAQHHHKILANYVVNLGLSGTGATIASLYPNFVMPLLGVYIATDVLASGHNSPINLIKESLAGVFDDILGDYL